LHLCGYFVVVSKVEIKIFYKDIHFLYEHGESL